MPEPQNKSLYQKVVADAKKRFRVWPSAYASGWVVQEYKRRGGQYSGGSAKKSPLARWYQERWIDVCQLPRRVACGRPVGSKSPYPYCRPLRRISKNTPRTVGELSKAELRRRCSLKRSKPSRRVTKRLTSKRVRRSRK